MARARQEGTGSVILRESDRYDPGPRAHGHPPGRRWFHPGGTQNHITGSGAGDRQPTEPPPQVGGGRDRPPSPPIHPGLERKTRNTFRNGWPRPVDHKKEPDSTMCSSHAPAGQSKTTCRRHNLWHAVGAAEFPKLMQHLRTKKETTKFLGESVGRLGGCAPVLHIAEGTQIVLQQLWRCRSRGPRLWPAGTCFMAKRLEHDSVHQSTASTDTRIVHQTECWISACISSLGDACGMMEWSFVFLFLVFKGTSVILSVFHCLVPQDRASVS